MKFLPLDQTDEESINDVLLQIDTCLQYGEDQEPREMRVAIKQNNHKNLDSFYHLISYDITVNQWIGTCY